MRTDKPDLETEENGWTIRVWKDESKQHCEVEIVDAEGRPALGFEAEPVVGLSTSRAEDHALQWIEDHPRYRVSAIQALGQNGHMAIVARHEGGEVRRMGPFAEESEALDEGEKWARETIRQDYRIAELRKQLSLELAGKVNECINEIDAIDEQKNDLSRRRKAVEKRIRELVREARNPQLPIDYKQGTDDADDAKDEDVEAAEASDDADDAPVADANGRHNDGPRVPPKKRGRPRKTTTREAIDDDDIPFPTDDPPPTTSKPIGRDPNAERWND